MITDPLLVGPAHLNGSNTVEGVVIDWYAAATNRFRRTDVVGAAHSVALRFKATFNMPSDSLINVVTFEDEVGTILRRASGGQHVFVPLIWRQGGE